MGFQVFDIILVLSVNFIHGAYSEPILFCNGSSLEPCPGENQVCNVTTSQCSCIEGFVLNGDECKSPNDILEHIGHSGTTAIVTIFALVLLASALVLIIRRHNLIDYVRKKIHSRRNHDVMYEDVMIGNDDPPLSP